MTQLPAEGRQGEPPDWPLGTPTFEQAQLWAELWATPAAAMWEKLGWTQSVARYTVITTEAREESGGLLKAGPELRQLEDRLGLNPLAMLRLRWEVVADELAERRQPNPADQLATVRRLRVADPGVATA